MPVCLISVAVLGFFSGRSELLKKNSSIFVVCVFVFVVIFGLLLKNILLMS